MRQNGCGNDGLWTPRKTKSRFPTFPLAVFSSPKTNQKGGLAAGRFAPAFRLILRLENARGRYALLLNPDVICLPGLLDHMVEFMDNQPEAAIAAPKLSQPDGTPERNYRRFPTPGVLAARALRIDKFWQSSHMQRYLMSKGEHLSATPVDWVTGAVLMARRSAVETVGLMDERYFLYWEDLDWCYRMRRTGWGVYHVPEARAIHTARREGVRRTFSRAQRAQLFGAIKFFRAFGWNSGKLD